MGHSDFRMGSLRKHIKYLLDEREHNIMNYQC